jgi:hypothetical protein
MAIDLSLLGKPLAELTPSELASLNSQLAALNSEVRERTEAVKGQLKTEQFARFAPLFVDVMRDHLAWGKPPKIVIAGEDWEHITVDYVANNRKSGGKKSDGSAPSTGRATSTLETGGVTMKKIKLFAVDIVNYGPFKQYYVNGKPVTEADNNDKGIIHLLTDKDGKPETCYELSKTGVSASDVITSRHPNEVSIEFDNAGPFTVAEMVKQFREARGEVTKQDKSEEGHIEVRIPPATQETESI